MWTPTGFGKWKNWKSLRSCLKGLLRVEPRRLAAAFVVVFVWYIFIYFQPSSSRSPLPPIPFPHPCLTSIYTQSGAFLTHFSRHCLQISVSFPRSPASLQQRPLLFQNTWYFRAKDKTAVSFVHKKAVFVPKKVFRLEKNCHHCF